MDPGQRRVRRLLHQLPADGQLPGDRCRDPAGPRGLEPADPGVRAAAVRGRDRRRKGEPDADARHGNRRLLRLERAIAGSGPQLRHPPPGRRPGGSGDGGRVPPAGAAPAVDAAAARLRHRHRGLDGRDRAVRGAVRAGHDAGGLVRAAGRAPRPARARARRDGLGGRDGGLPPDHRGIFREPQRHLVALPAADGLPDRGQLDRDRRQRRPAPGLLAGPEPGAVRLLHPARPLVPGTDLRPRPGHRRRGRQRHRGGDQARRQPHRLGRDRPRHRRHLEAAQPRPAVRQPGRLGERPGRPGLPAQRAGQVRPDRVRGHRLARAGEQHREPAAGVLPVHAAGVHRGARPPGARWRPGALQLLPRAVDRGEARRHAPGELRIPAHRPAVPRRERRRRGACHRPRDRRPRRRAAARRHRGRAEHGQHPPARPPTTGRSCTCWSPGSRRST